VIDLTVSPSEIVAIWPGGPGFKRELFRSTESGAISNDSRIQLDLHVGTHIESGFHRASNGKTIDAALKSSTSFFMAQVIDARGYATVSAEHFDGLNPETELAIFLTDNTNSKLLFSEFTEAYVGLDQSVIEQLARFPNLQAVGLDYISVESFSSDGSVHGALFKHEVLAIESLNLAGVEPGQYTAVLSVQILRGAEAGQCQVSLMEQTDFEGLSRAWQLGARAK
jgi:arylformamidase